MYDTLLELLLQKFSKTTEKRERDSLSQQILDLLKDPKVGIRAALIDRLHPAWKMELRAVPIIPHVEMRWMGI